MEPEGSFPRSQVPATCPCPEPYKSSPSAPSHVLNIHLNITLLSTPGVFGVVSFPQVFPPKPCIHITSPPCVLRARSFHFTRFHHLNNIWWGVQITKLLVM